MYKGKKQTHIGARGRLFLIGLALSLGTVLAASLVMSAVAYSSDDPTGKIGIYSLIALVASAAVSGFSVSRLCQSGGAGMTALVSLATVLILMLSGVIIGGKLGLSSVMNYLCYFGVAMLASLLGKKRERRRRRR